MNNWNWKNQIKKPEKDDEYEDLLVFGYSSRIYPTDAQSDNIAEERHMVPCWGDSENRVDRYDCRLLLHSAEDIDKNEIDLVEECPTEAMEEEMCQEERYVDLYKDIQLQKERDEREEEEERKRQSSKAQIGFSYGTPNLNEKDEDDSDSEDEPFEAPEGIKFPVGLELPPNMKLLHIIEKTASFVVANGAQMEIVIKAKQRNNLKNFGFLDFDHSLYPFYKYIQKLLREKKYTPNLTKKKKVVGETSVPVKPEPRKSSLPTALAAIAQANASDSDDDSDSDCELHPSLLGQGTAKRPPSPEKSGMIGPRSKPYVPNEKINFDVKPVGDFSQRNDVYANLFKNLAHVHRQAAGIEEVKMGGNVVEEPKIEPTTSASENDGRMDDPDYREWYQMFYHRPCPWIGPKPMLPPTPDLEPVLSSYAEYVARKGVEFEQSLAARSDLQLHFMDPKSPYFSYYHHKVRTFQWQLTRDYTAYTQKSASSAIPQSQSALHLDMSVPPPNVVTDSPGPSNVPSPAPAITPEVSLNRRQRRLLLDSNQPKGFGESVPISGPGIVDPIGLKTDLPKSFSTPSNLQSLNSKPISFTVLPKLDELKLASNPVLVSDTPSSSSIVAPETSFDPDLTEPVQKDESPSAAPVEEIPVLAGLEPPPPPAIPNNTQLDRKEKARIFMEKLLQEKRVKKQKEDEQRLKLEEESIRKAEKISEALSDPKKRASAYSKVEETSRPKVSTIDEIINSRINSLLVESGFKPEDSKKEPEKQEVDDDDDEKKKKKKHKKRSRSRSRSDNESDRKKSRKESYRKRSRTPERRRYRSRSRDRSYRR